MGFLNIISEILLGKYINLETRSSLDSGGHLNCHDDKDGDW